MLNIQNILVGLALALSVFFLAKTKLFKSDKKKSKCGADGKNCGC